jgi:hypothetical protein
MQKLITFDQLPQAVADLTREVSEIKQLLLQKSDQQTTISSEQLLTVHGAGHFLHLSVPTIYSKVSKGELPVMKRNHRLYFSQIELLKYLKEGRKKSNAEIEAEVHNYLTKK